MLNRFALLVAFSLSVLTSNARACFDGHVASYGKVELTGGEDVWQAERANYLGEWLPRIDAIIPEGQSVEVFYGEADVDGGTIAFPPGRMDILFRRLARHYDTPRSERRAALQIGARVQTIQIASTRDYEAALAMAHRLSEAILQTDVDANLHGFYEAGGFPADNNPVHVVESEVRGETVYRVVIGAFLNATDAGVALDALKESGVVAEGFVRRLPA